MFYYLHRALYKTGYFHKVNSILSIKKYERHFKIPVINGMGYTHLMDQEKWMAPVINQLLSLTKGAFVDVGMNIGQTMLAFYGLQKSNAYIGFEPNPACVYYCRKLSELNHFQNIQIFPVGLSDKNEILPLIMDMDYASGASLIKDFRTNKERYHKQIQVAVFEGDNIFEKNQIIPGIIKIDVEGAELEVLKGLQKVIQKDHPYCLIEILPVYNLNSENGLFRKKREQAVLKFFNELGYCFYRINERENSLLPLNDIAIHGNMNETNYVFVHESKAEEMYQLFI
ncbi:MAG: FkbM family methyltransferase [Bacteroidetes bacterium]|nr:FkbM family methyltransferase [Bacteroidota bacterium]